MGTANPKTTIDTHTQKKKQPKHDTKDGHQTTREENKRKRRKKRPTKTKPRDFAGGPVFKNPPSNAGNTGSIHGPGGSHMANAPPCLSP